MKSLLILLFVTAIIPFTYAAEKTVTLLDVNGNHVTISAGELLKEATKLKIHPQDTLLILQDGNIEVKGINKRMSPRFVMAEGAMTLTAASAEGVCDRNGLDFVSVGETGTSSNSKVTLDSRGNFIKLHERGMEFSQLLSVICKNKE